MRSFWSFLLVNVFVLGCSTPDAGNLISGPKDFDDTVILISFDGLRADYISWYDTPNLDRLIAGGAHASEGMMPVYPSKTFPNHYSVVTGLYPANHGIVSNSMYDSELDDTFAINDREAITDSRWWGGEPIWVTAENSGIRSATYFWVGSEAPVKDVQPTYWFTYDHNIPGEERVDQVLAWLDMPDGERPDFISVYFPHVDDAGHRYGPEAPETGEAVTLIDSFVGRLLDGLESRDVFDHVNIIITADHGMSQLSPDRVIALDDYIDLDDVSFFYGSPLLGLHPVEGKTDVLYNALKGAHPNLSVYRKGEMPERFHYRDNHRIPPIVGYADDGWSISRTRDFAEQNPDRFSGATHGFDNEALSMRATFIAHGSAFKEGVTIAPFLNIELYNVMAGILGIEPAPNDGTPGSMASILR